MGLFVGRALIGELEIGRGGCREREPLDDHPGPDQDERDRNQPQRHAHTLPAIRHHRIRQTIQIASRTIRFDILLTPTFRSTNTIGISTTR